LNSANHLTQETSTATVRLTDGLRGDAEIFKSVFDHSAAGLLVVSMNGRCVFANQAFCDLLGYTVEEVRARSMADITHPDDVALSAEGVRRLASGEASRYQIEKRYMHKGGRPV